MIKKTLIAMFLLCNFIQAHDNSINLTITKLGNDTVLSWTDLTYSSPSVYKVYRATKADMSDAVKIATVNGLMFSDIDALLNLSQDYYYQIYLTNEGFP